MEIDAENENRNAGQGLGESPAQIVLAESVSKGNKDPNTAGKR